jgi:transposase
VARDWRDDRIDELEALVRAQQATIEAQQATIEAQQATIEAQQATSEEQRREIEAQRMTIEQQRRMLAVLEARVRELEARLARHSGNSSLPPSADPPGAPPPAPPKRTGRRRGAQPGHPKHSRPLVPPEQVTHTEVLKPSVCRRCGKSLTGEDAEPYRHQVIDIPKVVATVNEYQLHALLCPDCGITTRATLPPGVPTIGFGPRLQAMVSLCSGDYRMSKRDIERMVEDFFSVPISLGSLSMLEQATSEAIAAPVEQVAQAIQHEPVVHADETGWYERSKRAWLWAAVTGSIAMFLIRASRGAEVAKELLGAAFAGILNSDRWSAYSWVDPLRRQLCWAHLLRHFRGFQDLGPEATKIGEALELFTEVMFHAWHQVKAGTLERTAFQAMMTPLRHWVLVWLHEGELCSVRKVASTCREILKLESALWTFVHVEGVEPTNNAAEQIVRHGVLWRKGSFGTDSPNGSRFVERILTVVLTLRLQKRNVLDYMTAACQAFLRGEPVPSLLPL